MARAAPQELHVDVVINDFGHTEQIRVARCTAPDGELIVDATSDSERWERLLNEAYERADGELENLQSALAGDYLFATPPHDERTCPFKHGPGAEMRPVGVRTTADAAKPVS
jgi:hypothetical protein